MTTSPELAAHPLNQVARVLTWGALALFAYGALAWLVARPWFALTTLEVKTPVQNRTTMQEKRRGVRCAPGKNRTIFTCLPLCSFS